MVGGQTIEVPLPPGTVQFQVALYSEPVVLASGGAASSVSVTLPSDIVVGPHTLVVWAVVGDAVSVTGHAFEATAFTPTGILPTTGTSVAQTIATAALLVAAGAAVVLISRRKFARQ